VEHDVPDQLVGDVYRLRQVVTNLVANAVKFTDSGEVVVTVEREQEADTHVVQFSVTDTGTGISADDQHRIFEPFVQSDTLTARHQGGVGLGLSISRELVRRMGGELKLTSIPGQGSRFWFSLPLRAGWDTTLGEFAWEDVRQLQGKSVLIVDANAASREVLTRMLTRWAMIPDIGVDYDHALGKLFRAEAEGRSFTLMIIDAGTAGMDGTMLLARLAETLDKVPAVVLMTYPGRARDDEGDNTGDRPAVEYLEKPVSTSRLLPTIRRALGLECSMKDTESKSAVLQSASRALSVLLAEDTPANQEVIRNVLVRRGHRVTVVGDGAEAAAVVEREAFDVVLMDVTMPVMDGYEATRAIRDREGRGERRVPIIALTAHAMQGVREACTAAGMDAHLVKPIDVGKLIELVESAAQSRVLAKHLELQATGIDAESPAAQIDMGYPARLADIDVVHSSTEGNGETIIDYRGALVRLGGDEALFRDVVRLFDQDTPGLLQRIRTCIDEDDAEELQRAAHSLRGLVANFGAKGVAERARCLEQMAKSLRLEGAMNVADELEWKVAQLNQALSRFREPQNTAQ
jgi:CheY-like chemotaxis protein/HPt (histidine-containing phosphotransfer) domain-containing protein